MKGKYFMLAAILTLMISACGSGDNSENNSDSVATDSSFVDTTGVGTGSDTSTMGTGTMSSDTIGTSTDTVGTTPQ